MEIKFSGWQKASETYDPYLRGGVPFTYLVRGGEHLRIW